MRANKITGRLWSIRRYASDIGELSNSLSCCPRRYNRVHTEFLLGNVAPIRRATALLQRCPNCGERGSMREKGIDGRHAEADSLGLGNQPGTTPFVSDPRGL